MKKVVKIKRGDPVQSSAQWLKEEVDIEYGIRDLGFSHIRYEKSSTIYDLFFYLRKHNV